MKISCITTAIISSNSELDQIENPQFVLDLINVMNDLLLRIK